MTETNRFATDPLPGPFAPQRGAEMAPPPAVEALAAGQVKALLEAAPAFYQLPSATRARMTGDLGKIAGYTAALIHDDWSQTEKLGQRPMVRGRRIIEGRVTPAAAPARASGRPAARSLADGFQPGEDGQFVPVAASNVARITEDTLNAIAFPTFVADLIKGTFQAIVDASIQQMEAYAELLSNVSKTVDQFMSDNITDNNARDWLAGAYPQVIRLDTSGGQPRLVPTPNAGDAAQPNFRGDLNLSEDVTVDDSSIEEVLVPAARRRIAQSRQQTLATMVLMGMNRIVVTRGRIKAGMGFRIDTTDRSRSEFASDFETRTESKAKYGWFLSPVSASVKSSVAYVSSSKKNSESELDVSADLTGEVDLQFKSDYFPLERFADTGVIAQIQQNTPNPGANKPVTGATTAAQP
ncbi:MAG TPA: hypothetical protein PKA33_03000 [Amaricoccus sp.]|uniref:hypothetical protein n=1 Tax=Amaricoccus sp. TaxID=1872485 RepID=UPI002C34F729|nr:hypothetical protein [Amaricoccus sp.]HMQ94235.1 hypothetical protein [Amaricoccus sp.]HMR51429.1 hypothetical protein [Amaricoccus sp.]HMR60647.1 hypothetical protein [Amaricoccus sp.]HMT98317.1 hypothetical protein [Amaricoccus sp.]